MLSNICNLGTDNTVEWSHCVDTFLCHVCWNRLCDNMTLNNMQDDKSWLLVTIVTGIDLKFNTFYSTLPYHNCVDTLYWYSKQCRFKKYISTLMFSLYSTKTKGYYTSFPFSFQFFLTFLRSFNNTKRNSVVICCSETIIIPKLLFAQAIL